VGGNKRKRYAVFVSTTLVPRENTAGWTCTAKVSLDLDRDDSNQIVLWNNDAATIGAGDLIIVRRSGDQTDNGHDIWEVVTN
jgi:hypothetical protein